MLLHRHCAVDEGYRAFRRSRGLLDAGRRGRARRCPITAVVHVSTATNAENISDEQIQSQIDVLNADFRARNTDIDKVPPAFASRIGDPLVEFSLATEDPDGRKSTGITRTRTRRTAFDGDIDDLDEAIKVTSGPPPGGRSYLTIGCASGQRVPGYAHFPAGTGPRGGHPEHRLRYDRSVQGPVASGHGHPRFGPGMKHLHIWGYDDLVCPDPTASPTPNPGINAGAQFPWCRAGTAPETCHELLDTPTTRECSSSPAGRSAMHAAWGSAGERGLETTKRGRLWSGGSSPAGRRTNERASGRPGVRRRRLV